MKNFFQIYFLIFSCIVSAQSYSPADTIHKNQEQLSEYFEKKTDQLVAYFKETSYYERKVLKDFEKQRANSIANFLEGSYLYFNQELEGYINNLLIEIAESNGLANSNNLRIFLSRDTDPNAMSLGDGNFIFSISLLNRLQNEDELKFIIAHELAHFQLKHLEDKIQQNCIYYSSEEYKKHKKATRKKRNKFSNSLSYIKDYLYENKLANRRNELEADSLGYLLFKNSAVNNNQAILALSKLDTISPSEIAELELKDYQNHFSSSFLPFQKEWVQGFDFSKYNYKRGNVDLFGFHKDSLRTHPQVADRIKHLVSNNPELKKPNETPVQSLQFKEEFLMEDVYSHYCSKEFGRGIYLTIQLQKKNELSPTQNDFLNHMLQLFYSELMKAKQSLAIKKYVDEVNVIDYSDQYNLFLTIINQLRSSEIKNLINKYEN